MFAMYFAIFIEHIEQRTKSFKSNLWIVSLIVIHLKWPCSYASIASTLIIYVKSVQYINDPYWILHMYPNIWNRWNGRKWANSIRLFFLLDWIGLTTINGYLNQTKWGNHRTNEKEESKKKIENLNKVISICIFCRFLSTFGH